MNQYQLQYDDMMMFYKIKGLQAWSPTSIHGSVEEWNEGGKNKLDRDPLPYTNWEDERPGLESRWCELEETDINLRFNLPSRALSFTADYLSEFDAVYFNHEAGPFLEQADIFKEWGGDVYIRDLGQSTPPLEVCYADSMKLGAKIIRYSPNSSIIPGYAGAHSLIRFAKDPADFIPWVGGTKAAMALNQCMGRNHEPRNNRAAFTKINKITPIHLYGPGNESIEFSAGYLDHREIAVKLSSYDCFLSGGSWPAPYTLSFMEAAMAGCPIVALGREALDAPFDHYEVGDIMDSWGLGHWVSSSPEHAAELIKETLASPASQLLDRSNRQRNGAEEMFGVDHIIQQWKELFGL